jgi:hypothetical protein
MSSANLSLIESPILRGVSFIRKISWLPVLVLGMNLAVILLAILNPDRIGTCIALAICALSLAVLEGVRLVESRGPGPGNSTPDTVGRRG